MLGFKNYIPKTGEQKPHCKQANTFSMLWGEGLPTNTGPFSSLLALSQASPPGSLLRAGLGGQGGREEVPSFQQWAFTPQGLQSCVLGRRRGPTRLTNQHSARASSCSSEASSPRGPRGQEDPRKLRGPGSQVTGCLPVPQKLCFSS